MQEVLCADERRRILEKRLGVDTARIGEVLKFGAMPNLWRKIARLWRVLRMYLVS